MTKIRLALDWTPNTNHIGFLIAQEQEWYQQQGLQLEILNPISDNYHLTPGKKLELGLADFAIAPFETVISLNNKTNKVAAIAVYAILQEDLSSIVTLQSSHIQSPKQLDGQTYASYKARYEDHIVQQMIINNGGTGALQIVYPDKLGIWNTLLEGKATATWIFDNWEGIEAQSKNVALNAFKMGDYGIPYGYSPVVLTKKENIELQKYAYTRFMHVTQKGFLFAQENPTEAVAILKKYVPENDLKNIDLEKSLQATAPYFGNTTTCGIMNPEKVYSFLNWLATHNLETKDILQQELFTNELLDLTDDATRYIL